MGFWQWAQFVGTVLTVVWAVKSYVQYHYWTFDEMVEDVKGAPLPLNEAGVEYWLGMLKPYVNDGPVQKRSIIQMHTKITTFIAVALFIQFLKIVRQKAMPIHRWLGRTTITVALLATPGFASLIYGLPHPVAQYAEYPIVVGIPYFGLKGWKEIREKKIQDHKASMIMFSACFFYFGVQRLMLMAMGVLHSGPWAEYMPLGPWKDWTAEKYNTFFGVSIALAGFVTLGGAMYKAYVVPTMSAPAKSKKP